MNSNRMLTGLLAVGLIASGASGQLYSDNFDVDTSASWNINVSSADTAVTFAYDYSADGIPPSPNGGGSTIGLKMEANIANGAVAGVTLSPMGQSFSGLYTLQFDMWINANGPFPGGGGGSTELLTTGIGYDDATVNLGGTGAGGWFAVTGEGGSSRDYRAYKNAGEQFAESGQFFAGLSSAGGGAHNNTDPYYGSFGGIDVTTAVPLQTATHPQQTGTTAVGTQAFAWHVVTIDVDEGAGTARWSIDGLPIAQLDTNIGSAFPLAGNISVGYMDIFSSLSDNPALSFGLIDNLVVIPEPASVLLLALGSLFLRRRR